MKLVSVNVATAAPLSRRPADKPGLTGINKIPVGAAEVGPLGLRHDAIVDTAHHGGVDQAVYLYSLEDYDWWTGQLDGRKFRHGFFGENLTVSSFGPEDLRIGDRFTIGDVELEVTSPRIPCSTFSVHMNVPDWIRTLRDARRPGPYAKVIQPGTVRAGMDVVRTHAALWQPTILDLQDDFYQTHSD